MADNEIIQEATEAVTKGYPCAFLVPPLLEVIERKNAELKARVLNACDEISKLIEQAIDEQHYDRIITIDLTLKNGIIKKIIRK